MNPTALDTLNKHMNKQSVWFTEEGKQVALAAMREISEMMFASGVDSVLDDGPGLEARLKQLFPEK